MDDSMPADLRAAYRRCRAIQRRHDPTFHLATLRLPREQRPAVYALYGFLRGADELVDGPGRPQDPAARRVALDAWEATLMDGAAAGRSHHPVIGALVDAGRRHDLPLERLSTYMDSMRVDCAPVRLDDDAALDRYMDGSAATVGRLMAPILDARELAEDYARLGVAFQLTNFIRDVREDLALDRAYLPGLQDDARAAVQRQVGRARELFAATARLHEQQRGPVRQGMRLARAVYEAVLDRVESVEFDVLDPRMPITGPHLARAAVGTLVR
jgi:15-cis-phytoene synthase